jgi:hypothetical protein
MKLRAAAVPLLWIALAARTTTASTSSPAGPDATPKQTLLDQTLHFLHIEHSQAPKGVTRTAGDLELKLDFKPNLVELSKDREVKVTVTLFNRSTKKEVNLNFPTSQRIEVLVRNAAGKVVNTWSEDQSFTNDPAAVTVNPGERLEYSALVPTREMVAGQPFVIEVSFPSYPNLKIQRQLTPAK